MRHDAQELLSVWEVWHWDVNKGGWLDLELCAKAKQEEVEDIRRHKMHTRDPRETCLRGTEKAPIKTGWARGNFRNMRLEATVRRAESCTVRGCHVEEKLWRRSTCEGRLSTLHHSLTCRQKITRQVTNTCAGCSNTAYTARVTPHKTGRKSLHRHSATSC